MGGKMNFEDFKFEETEKFTAEKINKILKNYFDNLIELYQKYVNLNKEYTDYKSITDQMISWLANQINGASDYINVNVTSALSNNTANKDTEWGQISLPELNPVSIIPKKDGEAIASCIVTVNDAEDPSYRQIINNGIWKDTISGSTATIKIKTSGEKLSYITIYPMLGTRIKSIYYNDDQNTSIDIDSVWPVKVHIKNDNFSNAIAVVLEGVSNGTSYDYCLKELDAYACDYADTAKFEYSLGNLTQISELKINDYIYPIDLASLKPLRIRIMSADESIVPYDTDGNPPSEFPLTSTLSLNSDITWKLVVDMKNVGTTPFIRNISIK